MPPDIRAFVAQIVSEAAAAEPALALAEDAASAEARIFYARFRVELPPTYIEICRLCDGFTDPGMSRLHGLQTVCESDEQFPSREGLLYLHDEQLAAGAVREDFVEFGNRDGVEPWGWDLTLGRFIRSDPNPLSGGVLQHFETFEEMFRSLFRLASW